MQNDDAKTINEADKGSIGSINGVLNLFPVKSLTKDSPAHGVARRKSRLFRHAHQLLRASLAPLPRLARPSGKPTPCPGIEPTAAEENAVELAAR